MGEKRKTYSTEFHFQRSILYIRLPASKSASSHLLLAL